MKKGFTLLEIVVVLIILGILATLAFMQYSKIIEKGRTAEAKQNLGAIRTMALAYWEENGVYPDSAYLTNVMGLPQGADPKFFFSYSIDQGTGTATATRNQAGGKPPDCAAAPCSVGYTLTLSQDGTQGSAPAGMW